MNAIQEDIVNVAMYKHLNTQQIDFVDSSTMQVEPAKNLQTGKIINHYRFSKNFLIIEKVLYGYANKKFLDGVTILTINSCKIATSFHIRGKEYNNGSSVKVVDKFLKEFLNTKENKEKFLQETLVELYSPETQKDHYDRFKEFVETFED